MPVQETLTDKKQPTRLATPWEKANEADSGDAGQTGYVWELQVTQHHFYTKSS